MEVYGQDLLPYGEGVKLSKTQGKEPSPSQQALGKKKAKKKKKKKKKGTQEDAEQQPSKSKKHPVFLSSPELHSNTTRDDDTAKETAGRTTHQLFSSTSNFSLSTESSSDPPNESLRWNGILDDPVAEEERLQHYRLNRRKRYGAYIQQSLPPEPSLTLRHLPQLCIVAHLNGDHFLCKTELTTPPSQNSET